MKWQTLHLEIAQGCADELRHRCVSISGQIGKADQMSDILPIHYALSEAAVAAAGAYACAKAWPVNSWFAIGLAAVALAGLVGAIRIAAGLSGSIVTIHEFLSRAGALFGLGCMFGAMLARGQMLPPLLGLAAAALGFFIPALTAPLFGTFILGGAVLAYRTAPSHRLLAAGSFAFLVCAALFSAPLRETYPGFAWHVFHMLVASWFVLVAIFVAIPRHDYRQIAKTVA